MSRSHQGKPVQILSIEDDKSLKFEYDELERILRHPSVKDKPVVVIAIAGAYRQGKSFLMNFFIRYMRNRGTENWLGDPEAPLEGFGWKHSPRRHTSGILLWDEVFLATTSDGEEVAVLFMDTQGLYDCESTTADCATIFALSVMTSSVQIYNILHNVQEDQLQQLEFFTQYGLLARKDATGRPFQRLVFLVRDSNNGTYGAEAGRELIEQRLQSANHLPFELQQLRQYIRDSFCTTDCFLMPHPGKEVATEKSYDGRLTVIDEEFKSHIQNFVPWILGPEQLVVKRINGKKISCQELLVYIKAYVQVFKSGELPQPKSMLQATAEASHLIAADKAEKLYMTMMSNIPHGDIGKLQATHTGALASAKEMFESVPKIGGAQMSCTYMDTLTNELQEHFNRLYKKEVAWLREQREIENRRRQQEAEKERKKQIEFEKKIRETEAKAEEKWNKEKESYEEEHQEELRNLRQRTESLSLSLSDASKVEARLQKEVKEGRNNTIKAGVAGALAVVCVASGVGAGVLAAQGAGLIVAGSMGASSAASLMGCIASGASIEKAKEE